MKLNGAVLLQGQFRITHKRNGKILSEEVFDNTVTDAGKKQSASLLNAVSDNVFKFIGLGSSSTTITTDSTDLGVPITAAGLKRASATCSKDTTTVSGDTAVLTHLFTATATQSVREAGIFSTATSGGVLLAAQTFTAKNMEADDTLAVTYKTKVA